MLPKPYDTMTEALNDLYELGFTYDFNLVTKKTYDQAGQLPVQDFAITQTFRFENNSDPAENSVLYVIVSGKHQMKGTLVNGFAIYADPLTDRFINSIRQQESPS